MKEKWIQESHIKKGALHHQLGYGAHEKIPKGVLAHIMHAEIGEHVHGHTVTKLMKHRANFALNVRRK
jgi:hypothetical protein